MPEKSTKITVPLQVFELDSDGFHLLLDVEIAGETFLLVLDTGASRTVFDKTSTGKLIGEQHILASEQRSTGLGITDMESYTAVINEIKLSGFSVYQHEVAVLDLSGIISTYSTLLEQPVLGVLGSDFLMSHKAIIDFDKKILLLYIH